MRPSSPLLDSVRDLFEGFDQLSKDFSSAFNMNAKMICDVVFNVIGGQTIFARNNPGHQNASLAALDPTAATAIEESNDLHNVNHLTKNGSTNFFSKSNHCIYCGLTVCQCTHIPDDSGQSKRIFGVRAVLAIRSRVFLEMLYGFTTIGNASNLPFGAQQQNNEPGNEQMNEKTDPNQAPTAVAATNLHQSTKRQEPQQSPEKISKGQSVSLFN